MKTKFVCTGIIGLFACLIQANADGESNPEKIEASIKVIQQKIGSLDQQIAICSENLKKLRTLRDNLFQKLEELESRLRGIEKIHPREGYMWDAERDYKQRW